MTWESLGQLGIADKLFTMKRINKKERGKILSP